MMNKMMGNRMGNPLGNPNGGQGDPMQNILNSLPIPPGMTREQYMAQCSQMMNFNPQNKSGGKRRKR